MLFLLSMNLSLSLLWFSKLVLPNLHTFGIYSFSVFPLRFFLSARNVFSLIPSQNESPTQSSNYCSFFLASVFPKVLKTILNGTIGSIIFLLTLYLIVNMNCVRNSLPVIFFLSSLVPDIQFFLCQ